MANETILLIEDDTDLLLNNQEYLEKHGYRVLTAEMLAAADKILKEDRVDLVLLDVNLPDGSGLDFIVCLREAYDIPVIFLTCRTDKTDVIEGLARGGCDYVTKPFDFDVLHARIATRLREIKNKMAQQKITRGSLTLNTVASQAFLNGVDMQLSQKEFAVLRVLVESEDEALTKEDIYETVWGQPMNKDDTAVKTAVSRLRKKLETAGLSITAFRGEGYRFE